MATLAVLRPQVFQTENAISILLGQASQDISRGMRFKEQPPIPNVSVSDRPELHEAVVGVQFAAQRVAADDWPHARG